MPSCGENVSIFDDDIQWGFELFQFYKQVLLVTHVTRGTRVNVPLVRTSELTDKACRTTQPVLLLSVLHY